MLSAVQIDDAQLSDMFREVDTDGDGKISSEGILATLSWIRANLLAVFQSLYNWRYPSILFTIRPPDVLIPNPKGFCNFTGGTGFRCVIVEFNRIIRG